jgi:hypothetical protein
VGFEEDRSGLFEEDRSCLFEEDRSGLFEDTKFNLQRIFLNKALFFSALCYYNPVTGTNKQYYSILNY